MMELETLIPDLMTKRVNQQVSRGIDNKFYQWFTPRQRSDLSKLLRRLLFITCIYTRIWPSEMRNNRHGNIIDAKRIFCHLARKHTIASFKMIGNVIGCDHATVMYHDRRTEQLLTIIQEQDFRLNKEIIEFKFTTLCLKK